MTEVEEYQAGILLALLSSDEPVPVRELYSRAQHWAKIRTNTRELALSTQSGARKKLENDDLVSTTKRGKHYYSVLTYQGEQRAQNLPDLETVAPETALPKLPFRVGKGHLLQPRTFGDVMKMVKAGQVDIIFIQRGKTWGRGYWDE